MANEITITAKLSISKDDFEFERGRDGAQFDWAGITNTKNTVSVGTSATAIDLSTLPSAGWAFLRNASTGSATIEIGLYISSTFFKLAHLDPGEYCLFPLGGDPYVKASAASTPLQYQILSAS